MINIKLIVSRILLISFCRPRIVTQDGNLVFQTGANHNITFRSSNGGRVNIDGMDVKNMAEQV